jgi:hypothetical protein
MHKSSETICPEFHICGTSYRQVDSFCCSSAYRRMLDSQRRVFPCVSSSEHLWYISTSSVAYGHMLDASVFFSDLVVPLYIHAIWCLKRRLKISNMTGTNWKTKRVILIYVRELHWRLPAHQLLCQFSHVPSIITTFSPNKNIGRFWYQLWNHKVQTLIVMKDVPLKYVWSR